MVQKFSLALKLGSSEASQALPAFSCCLKSRAFAFSCLSLGCVVTPLAMH